LLAVLAVLGAYMVSVSTVQRSTTTFAVLGARAERAARSGVEWAVYQAITATQVAATCGAAPGSPVTTVVNPVGPGLDGLRVEVSCEYTRHQEKGDCFYVLAITASSESGTLDQPDYVSRVIQATATDHFGPVSACP